MKSIIRCLTCTVIASALAASTGTAATVVLQEQPPAAAGIQLQVAMHAGAVSDLYGVAIDLLYDPTALVVVDGDPDQEGVQPKVEEGPVLNGNGADFTLLRAALEDGEQGRLVVGLTRTGTSNGVASDGTDALFTVTFLPLHPGDTTIVFANPGLVDSAGQEISADNWPDLALTVQATHTITATAGPRGAVQPAGEVAVLPGGDATFTMVPDQGFVVAGLRIDGQPLAGTTTYTFTNVTVDHTLHAIFRRLPGDLDGDGTLTLADAILAGTVLAHLPTTITIQLDADVDQDQRVGLAELSHILRVLAQQP